MRRGGGVGGQQVEKLAVGRGPCVVGGLKIGGCGGSKKVPVHWDPRSIAQGGSGGVEKLSTGYSQLIPAFHSLLTAYPQHAHSRTAASRYVKRSLRPPSRMAAGRCAVTRLRPLADLPACAGALAPGAPTRRRRGGAPVLRALDTSARSVLGSERVDGSDMVHISIP